MQDSQALSPLGYWLHITAVNWEAIMTQKLAEQLAHVPLTMAIQANWFMLGDFDIAQSCTLQPRLQG